MTLSLWVITNGAQVISEDTAYLIGRAAARFDRIYSSHLNFDSEEAPEPPDEADTILLRHHGKKVEVFERIGELANKLGLHLTNPAIAALRANDKRTLIQDFPDLVPKTLLLSCGDDFNSAFEELGGDIVVKEPFSSRGRHVRRINSLDDRHIFLELLTQSQAGQLVAQPFLSGFSEGDWRVIVVKDPSDKHKAIASFNRIPGKGQWVCNLSQGGRCEIRDPGKYVIDVALEVADRSGLEFSQLDFGWHNDKLYLIETNQNGGGLIDFDIGHRANCADEVVKYLVHCATELRR